MIRHKTLRRLFRKSYVTKPIANSKRGNVFAYTMHGRGVIVYGTGAIF